MRIAAASVTLFGFIAPPIHAMQEAVILQPAAITLNSMGEQAGVEASNLISQLGLTVPYVSGVTLFDVYVPTATHNPNTDFWNSAAFVQGGTMVFDLGEARYVSAIAQWQHSNFHGQSIKTVTLRADLDGDFSSGAISLGVFDDLPSPDRYAIVRGFTETYARFIEWTIVNYGNGFGTRCNEIAFRVRRPIDTAFCFGDGSSQSCPCSNESLQGSGAGCLHSQGQAARLRVTSVPQADPLLLECSDLPSAALCTLLRTTHSTSVPFISGDGLSCLEPAPFSFASRPQLAITGVATFTISTPMPAQTRYFQVMYRDANEQFCTASTSNYSNGVAVAW